MVMFILWYLCIGMFVLHILCPILLYHGPDKVMYDKFEEEERATPIARRIRDYLIAYVMWLPWLIIGIVIGLRSKGDVEAAMKEAERLFSEEE